MKKLYPLLFFCALFILFSQGVLAIDIAKNFSEIFIENKGQVKDEHNNASDNVLFYLQGKAMQVFVTTSGYSIVTNETDAQKTTYHKIDFKFENATIKKEQIVFVKGDLPSFNFYHATNSLEDVRSAKMVIIRNIYPGIDWVWTFDTYQNVKHEFMVNLGADAKQIQYSVSGADAKLNSGNNLIYSNDAMQVKEGPVLLQQANKKDLAAEIAINGNKISFQIPTALATGGFTIDPPLQLLWGSTLDSLRTAFKSITANDSLQTITVGYSSDYAVPTFPQTVGSYSVFPAKATDIIIMKSDPNQNLIWATFFGGVNNDEANAVASTSTGIFITGYSDSWDFPHSIYGDYTQPVQLFGRDAFIAKFDNIGKWKWATGYGGNSPDEGMDIKCFNGKVYVAGYTASADFPVLSKAGAYNYQNFTLANKDAFLLEFDSVGNRLWATTFGGSGNDYFTSVFADASGIYTTGYSDSITGASIPLLNAGGGAYFQNTFSKAESFVNRFSTAGALNHSSYFGGNGNDYASCIIRNNCGILICGKTDSTGLPVLSQFNGNYFQPTCAGGHDGFIAKFDANTLQQQYGTYYGSAGEDVLTKMATDASCHTITTGYTNGTLALVGSKNYYFIQDSLMGGYDALMLGLDANQNTFWATAFGSWGNDFGYSVWFPHRFRVDMVGEGLYDYGKWRIGGTYRNYPCSDINICPKVTSNGCSNRFFNRDSITGVLGGTPIPGGGGGGGGGGGCFSDLQFQALIPTKNTCPNMCNGEAVMDTANIGGCPPYQLTWNNGDVGIKDTALCEFYWSIVTDASNQQRVIYGRFDILRILYAEGAYTYCSNATPFWDSLIHVTGGGPPYYFDDRGGTHDTCPIPVIEYFDIIDTAGCILSYSVPWVRTNLDLQVSFGITNDCKLVANATVLPGTCLNISGSIQVTIYDGVDTFQVPYSSIDNDTYLSPLTFLTKPGRYYSGYLHLPDCEIPITGVYRLASLNDTISKVLACHADSGSIAISIPADTNAFSHLTSYNVTVTMYGDSSGIADSLVLTFTNSATQTVTFNTLPADVYRISVYINDCTRSTSIVSLKTVYFVFNSPNTYCGRTDTLRAYMLGGFPPYSFVWSPTAPAVGSIEVTSGGNYSVTVTDSHGCVFSGTKNVPGSSELNITSLVENTSPCSPTLFSSAHVSASGGTQPYSYVWSSGESNSSATYLAQGTNWVRVFDNNGCFSADTFQNTKKPKVNAQDTFTNPTCFRFNDGSISLTVSDGYPNYILSWVGGNSTSAANLVAGNYHYTVTDSKGCITSGLTVLTEPDSIRYFEFTNDATCSSFDGYANINVTGGSGNISMMWDDGDVNFGRFDLNAGIHSFTLTDVNGCYQDGEVNIGVYNPPLDYDLETTDVKCYGNSDGTALLTVFDSNTPITYQWNNGEQTANVFDFSYGPYTVHIKDAIGCSYHENIFISEPDPLYIYNIQTTDASCSSFDGYASVSITGGTPPYTVDWSDGGSGSSRNNLQGGYNYFTVTDFNNCQEFGDVFIYKTNPMVVSLYSTDITCYGANDGEADVTVTNALTPVTYQWSNGGQNDFISNLQGGNYTVTINDNRGCTKIVTATIYEPDLLVAAADTGNGIACYGGTAQVDIYGTGGTFPYTGTGTQNYGSGSTDQTIYDANGCAASVTFVLTDPAQLTGTVDIVQPTCTNGGGTVTINAAGGTAFYDFWYASSYQGSSGGSVTVAALNGQHSVQIIDSHGCEIDLDALVNDLVTPNGNIAYTIDPLCSGGSTGAANIVMNQGANPFTVQGFSFTDSTTVQNLAAGIYTYTVTDANNCETTVDFTLYDPNVLSAGYDVVQNFICSDDSALVAIYANGGSGSYTGTGSFHFAGGSFSQQVIDGNGCSTAVDFVLTTPPPFTIDTYIVRPNCTSNFGYVHIYPQGGVAPYTLQDGANATIFSDSLTLTLLPGNYTYTIADNLGCLRNVSFVLNNVSAVAGHIVTHAAHCNGDSSGYLVITITNGLPPYMVNGISFTDSVVIGNLPAGVYQYTITDANNCPVTLVGIVSQPTALIIDSTLLLTTVSCDGRNDAMLQAFAHGGTPAYTYTLISAAGDTTTHASNIFTSLGSGTYVLVVTDSLGCITIGNAIVDTFHHSHHRIERDSVNCYGKNNGVIKLYSEPSDRNPYQYSLNDGTPQVYNVFYNLQAGNYRVVVTDKFNCPDTLYTSITQPDSIDGRVWLNGELLPLDSLELDERLFADFTKQNSHPWEIEFSPEVQRLIQSLSEIKIQPREDITFTVTVYMDSFDRNCFVQYKGLIELRNVPPLPNIITPNGDGFNDIWKIDLDKFPNADVTIFDRWGEIIYQSKDYANDWDAMYHGKHIADGTYFYILKVPSQDDRVYKGNINVLNSTN